MINFNKYLGLGALVVGAFVLTAVHPAQADLPDEVIGTWKYKSHSSKANPAPPADTKLKLLEIKKDHFVYFHPDGDERRIDYELFKGDTGWVIDMYAQYGPMKGRLYPSRISLMKGELRLMMPIDSRAKDRRPKVLQAEGNPAWVVFVFERDVSDPAQ